MALFTDPADIRANSYVSLDDANNILDDRPYTDPWDNASQDPDARGYLIDGPLLAGVTTIPLKNGIGNFGANNRFTIDGDPTEYRIVADVASPAASVDITPVLVTNPADGVPVNRRTSSEKEAALLWATRVLDSQMDWFGSKRRRTLEQTLRWPRSGILDHDNYNVDQNNIPAILECVTAEFANELLQRDLASLPELLGLGFSEASMPGPFKIKADHLMQEKMVSDYLLNKMSYLGTLNPGVGGQRMRVVSLLRA